MPRFAASTVMDELVRDAMEGVVQRASIQIARTVAQMAADRLEAELGRRVAKAGRRPAGARSPRRRTQITRWAADRRARRVPNFVIDMTGMKTKKQIVAKYGEGVVFEKGRPAPKAK